jgi:hypothetical protein
MFPSRAEVEKGNKDRVLSMAPESAQSLQVTQEQGRQEQG